LRKGRSGGKGVIGEVAAVAAGGVGDGDLVVEKEESGSLPSHPAVDSEVVVSVAVVVSKRILSIRRVASLTLS
jgi:hypothetical protein